MFRVLDVPADGPAKVFEGDEALALVAPPPEGTVRWIDLAQQDEPQLALLGSRFEFHRLALEDCAHFSQRPKLEEYPDHLFIVSHMVACPEGNLDDVSALEVHAFLGAGYLVTVHAEPVPPLEQAWGRVLDDPSPGRRGGDRIYYLLSDGIVDAIFPLMDRISTALDDLEERILAGPSPAELERLFGLKRTLVFMRRIVSPQRDVFSLLSKRGDPRIGERTAFYFRDVYDHLVRLTEQIDGARELLAGALEAYLSMVGNRTNEVMKRLTILSAIFLPLAFITGFFGQNFHHLPFGSDLLMFLMIATCALLPAGMLLWFKRSGWM